MGARPGTRVPGPGELHGDSRGGHLRQRQAQLGVAADLPAEGWQYTELSLRGLRGEQLRRGQLGPVGTGGAHRSGESARGLRSQRGSVRDQVQREGTRQPAGEREHTAARTGYDSSDRGPAEYRHVHLRYVRERRDLRSHGEFHSGRVRYDLQDREENDATLIACETQFCAEAGLRTERRETAADPEDQEPTYVHAQGAVLLR